MSTGKLNWRAIAWSPEQEAGQRLAQQVAEAAKANVQQRRDYRRMFWGVGGLLMLGAFLMFSAANYDKPRAPEKIGTDVWCRFYDGSKGGWTFSDETAAESFIEARKHPTAMFGTGTCLVVRRGPDDPRAFIDRR